jgi:hypothetical protein
MYRSNKNTHIQREREETVLYTPLPRYKDEEEEEEGKRSRQENKEV